MRRRVFPVVLVGLALLVAGCGAIPHMTMSEGNVTLGKQYFTSGSTPACASCHTLAAAGAQGVVGPNLDAAFGPDRCQGLSQSTILDVVRGQIAYADPDPGVDWPPTNRAPALGGQSTPVPGMPPNLVSGAKARDIATFVASAAGITHGPGPHWDCATGSEVG